MRFNIFVVCVVALIASISCEDVLTLTTSNFDSIVNNEPIILVEFYAPWCGHCKKLAPEYEKAAGVLKKNDPPVPLAKVDATEEQGLGQRFGVNGYPTMKIFRNGHASEYGGPRDADGIVKYMKKQAGPSSRPIGNAADLQKLLSKATDAVVLGLFKDTSSKKYKTFTQVANELRDNFVFAESSDESVLSTYGTNDGVVLVFPTSFQSKLETMSKTLNEFASAETLKQWVKDNSIPLVGPMTSDNQEKYQETKKAVLTLWANIDFALDPKGSNYVANRLRKVAKEFEGKPIVFNVADIRGDLAGVLTQHGLSSSDLYAVTVRGAEGGKYVFTGLTKQAANAFKADGLSEFVQQYLDGQVEPFLKSEAAPEKSTVAGVTTLVAKNFDQEINKSGKPALIEFYAPWCGHCKQLAPTWDSLGKKLEKEDVIIAKMDATANDVPPGYDVRGFPTIFFKPAGGKPEQYSGGRDLKDFLSFLKGKVNLSADLKKEL